ncbi:MAG TPA: GNAT family N-acetyltransferase [Candidatus Solibacter sp.]|nr:GNAT family N-acetyltransferase [Candidatus Solibacter sp.]
MPSQLPAFTTKELSNSTWPDFVKLFSQGNGWDHCQCMHFHRACALPKEKWLPTRAERAVRNRREKKQLVDTGRSHGILVYSNGEPVGWCQYGPAEELPRIDNARNYRARAPKPASRKLWRITCFVVLKNYRKRGVATAALKAALASIKKGGGGLVEAYPIASWQPRAFGNESTHGTASMFKKAGFRQVALLTTTIFSTTVLMRKTVFPAAN